MLDIHAAIVSHGLTGDEIVQYEWQDGYEDDGTYTLRDALVANIEDEGVVEELLALTTVGASYEIGGGAAPLLRVTRIS